MGQQFHIEMNIEIISVHHGFSSKEKDLFFDVLERAKVCHKYIKRRLQLAKPGRDDWLFQQLFAGFIPVEERNLPKFQFIKDDFRGTETVNMFKEFVLEAEDEEKLKQIISQYEAKKKEN